MKKLFFIVTLVMYASGSIYANDYGDFMDHDTDSEMNNAAATRWYKELHFDKLIHKLKDWLYDLGKKVECFGVCGLVKELNHHLCEMDTAVGHVADWCDTDEGHLEHFCCHAEKFLEKLDRLAYIIDRDCLECLCIIKECLAGPVKLFKEAVYEEIKPCHGHGY